MILQCAKSFPCLAASALWLAVYTSPAPAEDLPEAAAWAMKKAAQFYFEQVATHGGYVYHYSLDLKQRWGEGVASREQIWVQPPATPTVGLAFLKAYEATGDQYYLNAATAAAEALAYGQLRSGGWTNCIDFNPRGDRRADYRNGKGGGKNNSSLDDGQTQSAIQLVIAVDEAHHMKHAEIHQAAIIALDALLAAQFPNGGFPQVWTSPVDNQPVRAASYPEYDWRTQGRVKNYWDMYTLNDNVCGYVAQTLINAYRIYEDQRYLDALRKLGDFLILAQLPDPQPAWAQQYNYAMHPIWARRFEPAAVSGPESQQVIETLLAIAAATGDKKYLEPIPRALAYLRKSQLPDGRLARYYELRTNRPLYMVRTGKNYTLTYNDANLPKHYGWKWDSRVDELQRAYRRARRGNPPKPAEVAPRDARAIISALDSQGRWLSTHDGGLLVGQAKMAKGAKYLSSKLFSTNLTTLANFVSQQKER